MQIEIRQYEQRDAAQAAEILRRKAVSTVK